MLEPEEEYHAGQALGRGRGQRCRASAGHSHLRLAAKIAMGYRGYGLPQAEVISEANVGLMQAVKRFDPEKGFRLATYAMWWIRASIQEYILRSWSLVKLGTTRRRKSCSSTCAKPRPGSARWKTAICAPTTSHGSP